MPYPPSKTTSTVMWFNNCHPVGQGAAGNYWLCETIDFSVSVPRSVKEILICLSVHLQNYVASEISLLACFLCRFHHFSSFTPPKHTLLRQYFRGSLQVHNNFSCLDLIWCLKYTACNNHYTTNFPKKCVVLPQTALSSWEWKLALFIFDYRMPCRLKYSVQMQRLIQHLVHTFHVPSTVLSAFAKII